MMLARPAASTDRDRFALIAASAAVVGGMLIGAARVARIHIPSDGYMVTNTSMPMYFDDDGMRPGVMIAVALLAIPIAAFAVQALRLGSVARDRRMAALRL